MCACGLEKRESANQIIRYMQGSEFFFHDVEIVAAIATNIPFERHIEKEVSYPPAPFYTGSKWNGTYRTLELMAVVPVFLSVGVGHILL